MLEIYNDVILHTTAVYDYEPHTLEMRKKWYDAKQQDGFPVFVATENDWNLVQVKFFRQHHYFTATTRQLRDGKKQLHLKMIEDVLEEVS